MAVKFTNATRNITRWDKTKVNYIGITKNGNTSMKHHLFSIEHGSIFQGPALNIHNGNTTKEISLETANLNGYTNIVVLRHPFTRFISMWKDLCITRPQRGRTAGIRSNWTPLELIEWILEEDIAELDVHFLPQYIFTAGVKNPVLLKLEERDTWPKKVELDYDIRPLVHSNETNVEIDEHYITEELKQKVYQMYHQDFEQFGYSIDNIVYPAKETLPKVVDPSEWDLKGSDFEKTLQRDKVLIVGSGRSAIDIKDWDLEGWSLVTINHAYQIRPDWEFAGYAGDFPKPDKPAARPPHQYTFSHRVGPTGRTEIVEKAYQRSYENAMKEFGKKHMTMFFNASYWALVYLKPKVIGYMGCDMNYEAEAGQPTHFYGIGKDIQKRGIPDPDKFIKHHYKNDKSALTTLFNELKNDCASRDCRLVNFSKEESRLPYDKEDWNKFKL